MEPPQFHEKPPPTCRDSIFSKRVISVMAAKHYAPSGSQRISLPLIWIIAPLIVATANAASLDATTSKAWEAYVVAATVRMEQRLAPGKTFLWADEAPDRLARGRARGIVGSPSGPENPKRVPFGLIHDWVGSAFITHATLKDVRNVLRDYARYKDLYQ